MIAINLEIFSRSLNLIFFSVFFFSPFAKFPHSDGGNVADSIPLTLTHYGQNFDFLLRTVKHKSLKRTAGPQIVDIAFKIHSFFKIICYFYRIRGAIWLIYLFCRF